MNNNNNRKLLHKNMYLNKQREIKQATRIEANGNEIKKKNK